MANPKSDVIHLKPVKFEVVSVPIVGTAPLVVHHFGAKAQQIVEDGMTGVPRPKKQPKDPAAEYEAAFYRLPDGSPGMPATAFKSATVQGGRFFEGVTMTLLKQCIFVYGEGPDQLVPIIGEPEMWRSPVRVGMGVVDLRYRPRFFPWEAVLRVKFNALVLSQESVANLIEAGGMGGVGEWRPSAPKSYTGTYGTYEVKR